VFVLRCSLLSCVVFCCLALYFVVFCVVFLSCLVLSVVSDSLSRFLSWCLVLSRSSFLVILSVCHPRKTGETRHHSCMILHVSRPVRCLWCYKSDDADVCAAQEQLHVFPERSTLSCLVWSCSSVFFCLRALFLSLSSCLILYCVTFLSLSSCLTLYCILC
jgi:hypothetical protein